MSLASKMSFHSLNVGSVSCPPIMSRLVQLYLCQLEEVSVIFVGLGIDFPPP